MHRLFGFAALITAALHAGGALALTPGLYEYAIKVNMPGIAGRCPARKPFNAA